MTDTPTTAAEMREAAAKLAEREGGWRDYHLAHRISAAIRALPLPSDDEMVEKVARALHFDFCDQIGWPNGQPTWDEMPDETTMRRAADTLAKGYWRSLARATIAAMRGE